MKINFFLNNNPQVKWNPYSVKNGGLGGNYTSLMNIAKTMASHGHDVSIFTYVNLLKVVKEDIYDGVKYRDISSLAKDKTLGISDIFISCESGNPGEWFSAKYKYNWIHRNTRTSVSDDMGFNGQIVASQFHMDYLEMKEAIIIPNGVDLELFNTEGAPKIRERNSIVYIGHPIKGMKFLPQIKQKIRELSDIEVSIHVYGNSELWGWEQDQFIDLQKDLIKSRIKYHGRVGQKDLSRYLKTHQVFISPSSFAEPFGMSMLEAMSSGCIPVVSSVGYPKTLIGDSGYVIDGSPSDFGWITLMSEQVIKILQDQDALTDMGIIASRRAKQFSWEESYKVWEEKILNIALVNR